MENTRKHTHSIRLGCIMLLIVDVLALQTAGSDQSMGGIMAICAAASMALALLCAPSRSRFSR